MATGKQVCQVLVVLRQHGERLFPTRRRLEETGERENPGGDDPVRVTLLGYIICYKIVDVYLYIYRPVTYHYCDLYYRQVIVYTLY